MTTEEQIALFIESEILEGTPHDVDPLAGGMMDSLAVEVLIGWLEDEFQITFDFRDVVAENFASISALAAFVDAKQRGAPGESTNT